MNQAEQRLAIVIATYNEIENLPELVKQLFECFPAATILVIDDNSPDGTGDWCDRQAADFPALKCLHREGKLGLGSATIAGFNWALEHEFDLVATMDADFSHDPNSLPELVRTLPADSEGELGVVIGSRYVQRGKIEGWPWFRRVASRAVNRFARWWLRLSSFDNSGAFRVYRSTALRALDVNTLQSGSYSYLQEILWRLSQAGYAFAEIPITFRDREYGQTKTNLLLGLRVFKEIFQMGAGWSNWRKQLR